LKRFPPVLHRIEGRVEDDAVRMQMWIQSTRRIVGEQGGCEVFCHSVTFRRPCPNSCRGERLKLSERRENGSQMGFKYSLIIPDQGGQRNRFWRRKRKII